MTYSGRFPSIRRLGSALDGLIASTPDVHAVDLSDAYLLEIGRRRLAV
jgi:hypothetical protein